MNEPQSFLVVFRPEGLGTVGKDGVSGDLHLRLDAGEKPCVEVQLRHAPAGSQPCGSAVEGPHAIVWTGQPAHWGREFDDRQQDVGSLLLDRWERLGEQAFDDLSGTLAAVVWDGRRGRLWCFRDKLGLVPIRYVQTPQYVAVSNDAEWLSEFRGRRRRADLWRLATFLVRTPSRGRQDYVAGLRRLRPREYAVWDDQLRVRFDSYWSPAAPPRPLSLGGAAEQFRQRIDQVIAARDPERCVIAMSGGIDSAFLASRLSAVSKSQGSSARAASMIAPGLSWFDESDDIARLERALDLEVHREDISKWWPLGEPELYDRFVSSGPQSHPGSRHHFHFQKALRRRFGDVQLLKGNGAEFLLGGYVEIALRLLWQKRRYADFAALASSLDPLAMLRIPITDGVSPMALAPLKVGVRALRNLFQTDSSLPLWLQPRHWVTQPLAEDPARVPEMSAQHRGVRRLDLLAYWGWEEFCRGAASTSRASGTTCDFPYVDPSVWELCVHLPETQLVGSGGRKRLLREAARGGIPEHIRTKPKHGVFDQLIQRGLAIEQASLVEKLMGDSYLGQLGVVDPERFLEAFGAYRQAVSADSNGSCVGSMALWRTISAELWLRRL